MEAAGGLVYFSFVWFVVGSCWLLLGCCFALVRWVCCWGVVVGYLDGADAAEDLAEDLLGDQRRKVADVHAATELLLLRRVQHCGVVARTRAGTGLEGGRRAREMGAVACVSG